MPGQWQRADSLSDVNKSGRDGGGLRGACLSGKAVCLLDVRKSAEAAEGVRRGAE